MKRILIAAAIALAATSAPAFAADIDVAINIGQPGYYGRIDIGGYPQPQVVYRTPVVIERVPPAVVVQPVYLYVPSSHQKNWRKYCGRYDACGQPVYFVQDRWYKQVYVPEYRKHHGNPHGKRQHSN